MSAETQDQAGKKALENLSVQLRHQMKTDLRDARRIHSRGHLTGSNRPSSSFNEAPERNMDSARSLNWNRFTRVSRNLERSPRESARGALYGIEETRNGILTS